MKTPTDGNGNSLKHLTYTDRRAKVDQCAISRGRRRYQPWSYGTIMLHEESRTGSSGQPSGQPADALCAGRQHWGGGASEGEGVGLPRPRRGRGARAKTNPRRWNGRRRPPSRQRDYDATQTSRKSVIIGPLRRQPAGTVSHNSSPPFLPVCFRLFTPPRACTSPFIRFSSSAATCLSDVPVLRNSYLLPKTRTVHKLIFLWDSSGRAAECACFPNSAKC